jgi:hypothetical protein
MKTFLIILGLAFLVSCKNNPETNVSEKDMDTSAQELSMKGVWKLVSYYNYLDNKVLDTINTTKNNKQIKMYTDSKVMWSRFRDSDTLDWFGYGEYSIGDKSLTETLDFGSKSMSETIKEEKTFVFKLILDEDKFSQIQMDDEGNPIYAENYIRIE